MVLAHFGVPFLQRGGFGVDVFFTLSGFLITSILLGEFDRRGDISFRNFYTRRLLRLFPALLGLLSVYAVLVLFSGKSISRHFTDMAMVLFYVANWVSAAGLNRPGELGHTWSLSVEEQFYVLWPAIVLILAKKWGSKGLVYGSVGLALLSMLEMFFLAPSVPWYRLYYGFDTRAFSMLLGCSFATLHHFHKEKILLPSFLERLLPLITSVGIVLFMCRKAPFTVDPDFFTGPIFIIPLLTCGLLYQAVMPGFNVSKRVLGSKFLVYFGKRSYGLYLWHYWIMNYWLMNISKANGLMIKLLWGISSLVIAEASFRFIESPFLKFKKQFPREGRPSCVEPSVKQRVSEVMIT